MRWAHYVLCTVSDLRSPGAPATPSFFLVSDFSPSLGTMMQGELRFPVHTN